MTKMILPKKFWVFLSLSWLAFLGFLSIMLLTSKRGIGVDIDSVVYITWARSFFDNVVPEFDLVKQLTTHYPPFFPFVLAVCSRLSGLDIPEACRHLHAYFFGFNILLVGLLLARYTKSALISIGGACAILISAPILWNHSTALSEPMFIFFMLLWLVFFMDFIENSRKSIFILCVMVLMVACLTRWAGVTLVMTSVVGIFLLKKESVKVRCIYAAVLLSMSVLPLLLWMAKNAIFSGIAIDRGINFHPHAIAEYNILDKLKLFSNYSMFFSGVESLILMAVMFYIGMRIWNKRDQAELVKIPDGVVKLIGVLFYFCFIYYIALVLTMTFIDDLTDTSDRILLPLNIFWILLVSLFLYVLLVSNKRCKFFKLVFIVFCLFVGGDNCYRTLQWALQRYHNGVGFENIHWDYLKLIAEVKKIPADKVVYTNSSKALNFFVKRRFVQVISKARMMATRPDVVDIIFMTKMKDDLRADRAVLIYLNFMFSEGAYPSLVDIKKDIPLKVISRVSDGAIYVWDDKT